MAARKAEYTGLQLYFQSEPLQSRRALPLTVHDCFSIAPEYSSDLRREVGGGKIRDSCLAVRQPITL